MRLIIEARLVGGDSDTVNAGDGELAAINLPADRRVIQTQLPGNCPATEFGLE